MNGIIKPEFFSRRNFQNHNEARKAIDKIITIYNNQRPHASLNYLTPEAAYEQIGDIKKDGKNIESRKQQN